MQRSIAQVGLGTARNFGTARPIFQSIVDNVPIVARTMYEMDLDMDKKKAKNVRGHKHLKENKIQKTSEKIKSNDSLDFDKYFSLTDSETTVSTVLNVPLAPYQASVDSTIRPVDAAAIIADAHNIHSIRISSLFLRLDQANVWTRGAHYEAFGPADERHGVGGSHGLCTTIRIVFSGWSIEDVKTVIGEAGRDWCTFHERRVAKGAPESVGSTRPQSPALPRDPQPPIGMHHAFIMPTLDFSSTFADTIVQAEVATPEFGDGIPSDSTGFSTPFSETPWSDMSLPPTSRPPSALSLLGDENEKNQWDTDLMDGRLQADAQAWNNVEFSADFSRRFDMISNF